MKKTLPVIAIAAAAVVFAFPALSDDRHPDHTAMKTVDAVPAAPAPEIVIEPAARSNPTLEIKTKSTMSLPLGAVYGNCNRSRQGQTVDLTQ
jgi:hypothetical protein